MTLKMVTTSRTVTKRRRMSRTSIVRTELLRLQLLRLRDVVLAAVVRGGLVVSGVLVADGGVEVDGVRDRAAAVLLRAAEIASLNQLIRIEGRADARPFDLGGAMRRRVWMMFAVLIVCWSVVTGCCLRVRVDARVECLAAVGIGAAILNWGRDGGLASGGWLWRSVLLWGCRRYCGGGDCGMCPATVGGGAGFGAGDGCAGGCAKLRVMVRGGCWGLLWLGWVECC